MLLVSEVQAENRNLRTQTQDPEEAEHWQRLPRPAGKNKNIVYN